MKTNKKIAELLLQPIQQKDHIDHGLCWELYIISNQKIINRDEHDKFMRFIDRKLNINSNNEYKWMPGLETPRIKWLKSIILKSNK